MSEGGEARNHEAEVEAVATAIAAHFGPNDSPYDAARSAIAALDAVRRSPQSGDTREPWERALDNAYRGPLETPGGKGGEARNEAEIEAVKEAVFRAGGLVSDAAADRIARAALDAVRRSPQGGQISDADAAALDALADHPKPGKIGSPQGEDHEALRRQVAQQAATIEWYRERFGDTGQGDASTDHAYRRAQGDAR